MTVRIKGLIEADGVIRIRCGTDEIEIEPVSGGVSVAGGGAAGGGLIQPNAGDVPILSMIAGDPTDRSGRIDVDDVLRRLRASRRSSDRPAEPVRVLLRQPAVDLHSLVRLSRAVSADHPHAEIAVQFSRDHD